MTPMEIVWNDYGGYIVGLFVGLILLAVMSWAYSKVLEWNTNRH